MMSTAKQTCGRFVFNVTAITQCSYYCHVMDSSDWMQSAAATLFIDASALVAELFATAAGHVVAALRPLDPEVAVRALFEVLIFGQ